jgi:hypothetical protein
MMDVLAHDIMRYEMLSEQDEYKAASSDVNKTYSLFYNVVSKFFYSLFLKKTAISLQAYLTAAIFET